MPSALRLGLRLGLFSELVLSACLLPRYSSAAQDYSAAERAIFMADHLRGLTVPATLRYSFRKSGSLEAGFDDSVAISLSPRPDGACCTSSGTFLSGTRQVPLPDVDNAHANPVILYFLERDIREMHRLTKGAESYFRKRIRMNVYQGATVTPTTFRYQGKTVQGEEVTFKPYLDDPNRRRFEQLAAKEYHFLLSSAVPGGVVGIRTRVAGASANGPALLAEDLTLEGADLVAARP